MEEAAEVVQAGAKLLQFGDQAGQYDNWDDFISEYEQLRGFVIEMCERRGTPYGVLVATKSDYRNGL